MRLSKTFVYFGLLLAFGLMATQATAQSGRKYRILVADATDIGKKPSAILETVAAHALYKAMKESGRDHWEIVSLQDWRKERQRNEKDLKPADIKLLYSRLGRADLLRVARELEISAIAQSEVITQAKDGKVARVAVGVLVTDVRYDVPISGGAARSEVYQSSAARAEDANDSLQRSIEEAASLVVGQIQQREIPKARILNRLGEVLVLNRGQREGMIKGGELTILREGADGLVKVGQARLVRITPTHSEAEVTSDGGIRPDDLAWGIYRLPDLERVLNAKQ